MTIEAKLKEIVGKGLRKEEKIGLARLNRLLQYPEYDEIPVGPERFLISDKYLGMENEVWKEVKQDVVDFFNSGAKEGIICAGIGAGKCHAKGADILMHNGTIKKVEQIRAGNLLMGVNSKPRKVLSLTRGKGVMYKICPVKGDSFIVNAEHILSLKRTNKGIIDRKGNLDQKAGGIVNIPVKDYLRQSKKFKMIHKLWRTGVDFPEKKIDIDPYFLGIWLGDGNNNKIGVTTADKEIKEYIYKIAMDNSLGITINQNTFKTCPTYVITGQGKVKNHLLEIFRKNDLFNNKHIPFKYKVNSRKIRLQVLAGLIDSDGSLTHNCLEFSNKNRQLCEDVLFLCRSLGFAAYLKERFTLCKGKKFKSYRIMISGELSGIPALLKRKQCCVRKQKKSTLVTGFSVKNIGEGKYYGFTLDKDGLYLLKDFTVTHNSFTTSLIFAYLAYRLLCLKDPQSHLRLARGSTIMLLNMGKTGMQSKKVVFHEISNRIKYSNWFRTKYPPDSNIRSELRFPKDIVIFPGNAKETFPLGYNLYGGIIDEASWHIEASERDTAEGIYNAMRKRIVSRAGGYLLIISSPRYVNDFTEKKMKEAEKHPNRIFSRRRAIWDVKPEDLKAITEGNYFTHKNPLTDELLKIPNKYKDDFEANPELALRDYGAIPSKTTEIYFKNEIKIRKAFNVLGRVNPVKNQKINYNLFIIEQVKYYAHIDLGEKVDAAGITMCHREGNKIVIDFILRLDPKEIGEIDFEDIRKIFFELDKKGAEIGMISYDGWQSTESRQQFEKKGIPVRIISIDRGTGPYDTLKSVIYQDRLKGVGNKQAITELLSLEILKGRKLNHPRGGSKDVADSLAGAVFNCIEFEFGDEAMTMAEKEQELLQKGEMKEPQTKEAEIQKELEDDWWK